MKELADEFWKKNKGKGMVTKVTDYSFTWSSLPDKNGKTIETVYYPSYFLKLGVEK